MTLFDPEEPLGTLTRGGKRYLYWADGTVLPFVSGGDGPEDNDRGQDDDGDGQGGGDGDGGAGGSDRTFTQDDVDRIVRERLARAKTTPPADYEDLKKAAEKLAEIEAANKSDLERAQEAQRQAEERATAAEARVQEQARRAAVLTEALKANAADPDDVYALLDKDAVTIGDDGQVTGAKEAVTDLLKRKPHLVGKKTSAGSADGGTRTSGAAKPKTLQDAVTAAMAKTGG